MGKKSRSRSGMNIYDHISESLDIIFWVENTSLMQIWIRKLFDLDPGSEMEIRIRDKHLGSGINIPDPHH
jgi:hypothetical protein